MLGGRIKTKNNYSREVHALGEFSVDGNRKFLLDHWRNLSGEKNFKIPYRKNIKLSALGQSLSTMILRKRFGARIVKPTIIGTDIDDLNLASKAGQNLFDTIHPSLHPNMEYLFNSICSSQIGCSIDEEIVTPSGTKLKVKSLLLPLKDNDGNANYIIASHDITSNGYSFNLHGTNYEKIIDTSMINLGYGVPDPFIHRAQKKAGH